MNMRLTVLTLVAAVGLAATPRPAWAGVVEDLEWAENEMDAPADKWDRPALAATLANVLQSPRALTAAQFLWARTLAARVAVEVYDRTAADRRIALNDLRVKAIDDATEQYLSADATDPRRRMDVFETQLHATGEITNGRRSRGVQEKIVAALTADVKSRVVESNDLSALAKAALIRRAAQTVTTTPPAPVRSRTLMTLYGYVAALDTPDAAAARLEQGKLLLAAGNRTDALERFDTVLKDAAAEPAVRLEARRMRVRLLTGGVFVRQAAAEIEALAASDLPGDSVLLSEALWARRRAGRVLLAAGYWTLPKYRASAEDVVADLIEHGGASAPHRADLAAEVLADLAVECRRLGQPHAGIGFV